MESLIKLPRVELSIGDTGAPMSPSATPPPSLQMNPPPPSSCPHWLRSAGPSGAYGLGDTIKVQSVNQALAAITATMELGGQQSPVLQSEGKYITPLHQKLGKDSEEKIPHPSHS